MTNNQRTICDPSGGRLRRYTGGICPVYLFALLVTIGLMLFGGCSENVSSGEEPEPEKLEELPQNTIYVGSKRDGMIYAIDMGSGEDMVLVTGSDPAISPEGTLVCDHSDGLVEYTPGEAGYRVIVPRRPGQPFDESYDDTFHTPRVSPNGFYVAYEGDFFDLHVVERLSGELVASFSNGDFFSGWKQPSWTADNRLVMTSESEEVYTIKVADPTFTLLSDLDTGPLLDMDGADVSREGMLVSQGGRGIYEIELAEPSNYEVIGHAEYDDDVNPTWSEDGSKIGWLVTQYTFDNRHFWHADGRGYQLVLFDRSTGATRNYQLSVDAESTYPRGFSHQFAIR